MPLIPALATRLGVDLAKRAVAVVLVGAVDFGSIGRWFDEKKIAVPLSIITDADPTIESKDKPWREHLPKTGANGKPDISDRAKAVQADFVAAKNVLVAVSELTLEYDLALGRRTTRYTCLTLGRAVTQASLRH